jgi:hypothetical protein
LGGGSSGISFGCGVELTDSIFPGASGGCSAIGCEGGFAHPVKAADHTKTTNHDDALIAFLADIVAPLKVEIRDPSGDCLTSLWKKPVRLNGATKASQ